MNDPFSEVLLREDVLITDKTPHSTTGCSWTIPAGLCILRKVGGSEVGYGMAKAVQRSTGIKP